MHDRPIAAYRALGLSTVALIGKAPIGEGWPTIAARRTGPSSSNIGLLCGHWERVLDEPDPSRTWIVALDCDNHGPHAHNPDKHPAEWQHFAGMTGLEVLEVLEGTFGKLPETWLQLTPSGGRHYVFRHPGPTVRITTRAGIWPGIDCRGDDNGQIVAAPSIHPDGGQYAWEASLRPGEVPLAELPPWLLRELSGGMRRNVGEATGKAATSFLGRCFAVADWLGYDLRSGHATACCPWLSEHSVDDHGVRTGDGGDTSCKILAPTVERPLGTFHCHHGHCSKRGTVAALRALPVAALRVVAREMPEAWPLAWSLLRSRRSTP